MTKPTRVRVDREVVVSRSVTLRMAPNLLKWSAIDSRAVSRDPTDGDGVAGVVTESPRACGAVGRSEWHPSCMKKVRRGGRRELLLGSTCGIP